MPIPVFEVPVPLLEKAVVVEVSAPVMVDDVPAWRPKGGDLVEARDWDIWW